MTKKWTTSLVSGVALFGMVFSSMVPASAEQAASTKGPGVTRVSAVQGSVVVQRGDSNKQVAAVVNAPLLPGDYISTGGTARGELQFDGSTAVRLGGNVQARITNDDPNNRQLQLADGTVVLGLVRNTGRVQVDTPSVTVRTSQAGDYRISIGKDGSTWVTTRRGTAEIVTPQRAYTLESGRTLVARGSASDPSITYTTEVGYDSFDDFNAKRDQTMVAALNASPNLNPDIAGYDNLGAYGQWQNVAGYGQAWVPQQSSDWSPYGNGSWTWEDGYGWTWVANEPWGWAPYHYGNWTYANGYGWAWVPPAYNAYPSWSPALVGFFGFGVGVGGAGWGVSVGFGSGGYGYGGYPYGYGGFGYPYIGWYPIPPYVAYYPWWPGWAWSGYGWGWGGWGGWGCCGGNVYNITRVTNIYRYFPHGGVHGTMVGHFQHGTISGHTFVVNSRNVGSRVGMIHGAVPITPGRESLGFGGRAVGAPVTLSRNFDSPRFASVNHTVSGRMSFDQQQRSVARAIESNTRGNAPVTRDNAPVTRDNASVSRDNAQASRENAPTSSWQRFDQTRGNDARATATRPTESRGELGGSTERAPSDSWNRFSQQRNVPVTYGDRANSARGVSYGTRDSYPSYARESTPSYARQSAPSYSRGSYGSYPSYARGSTYGEPRSYGSGYSAPRSYGGGYSAPRSYGGYSAPHSYGGGYSAPHSYGGGYSAPHGYGGGYSAPHQSGSGSTPRSSGGGGSRGRPPQQ